MPAVKICFFTPLYPFDRLPQMERAALRGSVFPTSGNNQAEAQETEGNNIIQEHRLWSQTAWV